MKWHQIEQLTNAQIAVTSQDPCQNMFQTIIDQYMCTTCKQHNVLLELTYNILFENYSATDELPWHITALFPSCDNSSWWNDDSTASTLVTSWPDIFSFACSPGCLCSTKQTKIRHYVNLKYKFYCVDNISNSFWSFKNHLR